MAEEENKNTEEQNEEEIQENQEETTASQGEMYKALKLSGMYENWFLDYASYVILERAVPDVIDGLKPVQRRIMHAMKELDDGRYNKVANIIGHTMKYHPHGDASIGDALVQLGQKELLVDTQGNWGNVLTGDSSAAPRYIEARLSKFALEVVFNPKTTAWKASYDGRNKEPLTLPVKFPLLLAQGVEGIAVGLASKILPHNFNELIDASIRFLQGKEFELFPDFLTGGMGDFTKYNDGLRGSRIRLRAKINKVDNKTLSITEIPFGTTTTSLIDSIVAANDKGKIKVKKIDDNTAEHVEINIHLNQGISPDQTIDALYAFTNCEVSISPNCCVIYDGKPQFIGVSDILKISTDNTVSLLKKELEIHRFELEEEWHFLSLEKIFIEERIYRKIEKCTTWESVLETIDKGLDPFKDKFKREITREDIVKLTEIRIKRISKFSSDKTKQQIEAIEGEIEEVQNHLDNLIDFAINYFRQIKKKYGKDRERKTEIRNFDTIEASMVAAATQKLYVNREEGFAGTSLRKDEYVCDCSDIDDLIVFREDGTFVVTKVAPKTFVGKNVLHIDVFKRNDDRTIYNMIYRDGYRGNIYIKRFPVLGVTRDKEYNLTKGTKGTKTLYFTANPNGEAEVVKIYHRPKPKLRKLSFEFDFSELAIKGRGAKGNILTRHSIRDIVKKEEGVSTLGAIDIWYDDTVKRLNTDERGIYLGAFRGQDKILTIMKEGYLKFTHYDVSTHFDEGMIMIQKFDPTKIISVVYYEGDQQKYYVKRFQLEENIAINKDFGFIGDHRDSEMLAISLDVYPRVKIEFVQKAKKPVEDEIVELHEFIAVKSISARGKRASGKEIRNIKLIDPLPYQEPEKENGDQPEVAETEDQLKGNENTEKNVESNEHASNESEIKTNTKTEGDENDSWQMTLDL
ncbi:MAG: DNA gyrase/topoisomerase IV subunit A [Bacteroidales bacterium]|nr:DNA gyrase/topoisomerase IV subunit A [Bacteroidales bacterium]